MTYGSIVAVDLLCCTAPRLLLVDRLIAPNSLQVQFGPAGAEKQEQTREMEQQQKQKKEKGK